MINAGIDTWTLSSYLTRTIVEVSQRAPTGQFASTVPPL